MSEEEGTKILYNLWILDSVWVWVPSCFRQSTLTTWRKPSTITTNLLAYLFSKLNLFDTWPRSTRKNIYQPLTKVHDEPVSTWHFSVASMWLMQHISANSAGKWAMEWGPKPLSLVGAVTKTGSCSKNAANKTNIYLDRNKSYGICWDRVLGWIDHIIILGMDSNHSWNQQPKGWHGHYSGIFPSVKLAGKIPANMGTQYGHITDKLTSTGEFTTLRLDSLSFNNWEWHGMMTGRTAISGPAISYHKKLTGHPGEKHRLLSSWLPPHVDCLNLRFPHLPTAFKAICSK